MSNTTGLSHQCHRALLWTAKLPIRLDPGLIFLISDIIWWYGNILKLCINVTLSVMYIAKYITKK